MWGDGKVCWIEGSWLLLERDDHLWNRQDFLLTKARIDIPLSFTWRLTSSHSQPFPAHLPIHEPTSTPFSNKHFKLHANIKNHNLRVHRRHAQPASLPRERQIEHIAAHSIVLHHFLRLLLTPLLRSHPQIRQIHHPIQSRRGQNRAEHPARLRHVRHFRTAFEAFHPFTYSWGVSVETVETCWMSKILMVRSLLHLQFHVSTFLYEKKWLGDVRDAKTWLITAVCDKISKILSLRSSFHS